MRSWHTQIELLKVRAWLLVQELFSPHWSLELLVLLLLLLSAKVKEQPAAIRTQPLLFFLMYIIFFLSNELYRPRSPPPSPLQYMCTSIVIVRALVATIGAIEQKEPFPMLL